LDVKTHLLEARRNEGSGDHEVDAGSPATTRLLNYYLSNSEYTCRTEEAANPWTSVTRKTHKDLQPPPIQHDLGGHEGKLS
jgi:hypothetical protein